MNPFCVKLIADKACNIILAGADLREIFKRYLDYLKAEKGASPYTLRNYRADLLGTYKRGEGKGFFQFLRLKGVLDFKDVDKQNIRDTWPGCGKTASISPVWRVNFPLSALLRLFAE